MPHPRLIVAQHQRQVEVEFPLVGADVGQQADRAWVAIDIGGHSGFHPHVYRCGAGAEVIVAAGRVHEARVAADLIGADYAAAVIGGVVEKRVIGGHGGADRGGVVDAPGGAGDERVGYG